MSDATTSDPVVCHNCRAELHGPFCAQCGQEALPLNPRLRDVVREFAHELLDMDGRVFRSVRKLFLAPGFLTREQFEPTEAFEIIYSNVMGRMHTILTRLVAVELALDPESEDAKLESFAFMGQVLVFRIARAAVLRRLGWRKVGPAEGERIAETLRRSVRRLAAAQGERP